MLLVMRRIAICGWDERAAALLHALTRSGRWQAVAIGDHRPAALVRARAATGLPCYQHLHEMLRVADYDAVLLGTEVDRESLAELVAERGADLLLRGDVTSAAALAAAADLAAAGGLRLAVVRPELRRAGLDLLTGLVTGDLEWAPSLVTIDMGEPQGVVAALSDVAAIVARLHATAPTHAVAAAVHPLGDDPSLIAVQARHGGSALTTATARHTGQAELRIAIDAPAGSAVLEAGPEGTTLKISREGGAREQSELVDDDLVTLEVARLNDPGAARSDALHAAHEAAFLQALEASLATGFVAPVHDPGTRGTLRVLEGGRQTTSPRQGHLRVLEG